MYWIIYIIITTTKQNWESHITTQIWSLVCSSYHGLCLYLCNFYFQKLLMWKLRLGFTICMRSNGVLVLSVCIYNFWEFCFINNLIIVNYFICISNYVLAVIYWQYKHICLILIVHCNIGYCITLLYNKNVALKGFLHGCRPTRLNHVTLMFLMFLFYVFPSAFTLVYTVWYNTSH